MEFKSINDLEKWFYKNKGDIVKFHFDLSNCLYLYYGRLPTRVVLLFCDKIKKECALCKMQSAFEKEKKNGLERLVMFSMKWKY